MRHPLTMHQLSGPSLLAISSSSKHDLCKPTTQHIILHKNTASLFILLSSWFLNSSEWTALPVPSDCLQVIKCWRSRTEYSTQYLILGWVLVWWTFSLKPATYPVNCHAMQPTQNYLANQKVIMSFFKCFAEIKMHYTYSIPTIY